MDVDADVGTCRPLPPASGEWTQVRLRFAATAAARTLLSFGANVEVTSPASVCADLGCVAGEVVACYECGRQYADADGSFPGSGDARNAMQGDETVSPGSFRDRTSSPSCATVATDEEVPVRTISHRELRNNSAEVLRAVGAGETIEVTNHGEVAAVLVPPSLTPYERLVAAGKVREPRKDRPVDLRSIRRVTAPVSSTEIIADVRGDR